MEKNYNCNDCENFKVKGEQYNHWNQRYFYGECMVCGEYKTTLTPCIKKYTDNQRWCSDEYIQLNQGDFCRRYHHDCDNCFSKKFWEELVAEDEVEKHFVNTENYMEYPNIHQVYYICNPGEEGGFYGDRFNVKLDNGEYLENRGLWGNGFSPNKEIVDKLKKGKFIR